MAAAGAVALTVAVLGTVIWWRSAPAGRSGGTPPPALSYVGSQSCAACHQGETQAWERSQHAHAMAEASAATVSGRFDGTQVTFGGVTSTFFLRDGRFVVRTDGPDGQLADFEVAYTFGVEPLQQYLVAMPGGRLQALSLAWDTRPAAEGGQRWFHLYAADVPEAGDPLHWTGLQQNWNFMCADCHSTNLRKGYNEATREFTTTWSEISVGCESCHGPGSEHAALAASGRPDAAGNYGLTARLDERRQVSWTFDTAAGIPVRSEPRTTTREIDVCARCHSRRAQLTDDWKAGDPFENGFRPASIDPSLYHVDGQQLDEVYNYGSFLQSRMFASGVTCSDCHDPHSGSMRLPGNATCTQCHQAPRFDSPAHHFHEAGTAAAQCATCHMPTTTYMTVDPRHDHRFGIPRPDLTMSAGVPNACTTCHVDRPASWAALEIQRRSGRAPAPAPAAAAFAAAARSEPDAALLLRSIATDRSQPAVVRGGAIARLAAAPAAHGLPLEALARDPDPMVRRSSLLAARTGDAQERLRLAVPLLSDPLKTVRVEAAGAIADLADRQLSGADLARFESAFAELVAEQRFNADRPEAQANLGTAWMARGRQVEAVAAFRESVRLEPAFEAGWVNLADVYRLQGNEREAYDTLRRGAESNPSSAGIRHALGLSLVRQRRIGEAVVELARAAELEPGSARYAYVYAVALHDSGRPDDALRVLRASLERHAGDVDTLTALALYSEQAGRMADARGYAQRLLAASPTDPAAAALARRLEAAAPASP